MKEQPLDAALQPHKAPVWPPPWWAVVSTLILLAIIAGLIWAIAALAQQPGPASLPTPILITVTPAEGQPTAILSETPAAVGQFKPGDVVRVSGTGGFDLRLRSGPGTLYETLKLVAEGTQLAIVGEPRQADNYLWWPVRDPADGKQGWVVSDYLEPVAP